MKVKETYCSYEVSKLLNEKGFEIDTNLDYWKIGEYGTKYFMCSIGAYTDDESNSYAYYRPKNSYPCPTHQMAMRWLREVHKLAIIISPRWAEGDMRNPCRWHWEIKGLKDITADAYSNTLYDSYEEATEAALKYSLENLI